jgi:hypothetical protein
LDDSLLTALIITVVGMTLLFLFLVLFYGLLALLAAVFKDRPSTTTEQTAGSEGTGDGKGLDGLEDAVHRAAVVAVALARAEAEEYSGPGAVAGSEEAAANLPVSAWWSLHHQRQVTTNPGSRRSR